MNRLSTEQSRGVLAAIWFGSFVLNLAIVLYLYLGRWIEEDNFSKSIAQISSLYVTYLGIVIAFYFGSRQKIDDRRPNGAPFVIALWGSLLWNALIIIFMVRVLFLWGPIEDSIKQIADLGNRLSWLVAPAIGYYFASSASFGRGKGGLSAGAAATKVIADVEDTSASE